MSHYNWFIKLFYHNLVMVCALGTVAVVTPNGHLEVHQITLKTFRYQKPFWEKKGS